MLTRKQYHHLFISKPATALYLSRGRRKPIRQRPPGKLGPPSYEPWDIVMTYGRPYYPLGKILIPLCRDHRTMIYERQARLLVELGIPERVVLAYQEVLLLYLENIAITRVVKLFGISALRKALPEIQTRNEAVTLMTRAHSLTANEGQLLQTILPNRIPILPVDEVQETWKEALASMENEAYQQFVRNQEPRHG